MLSCKIVACNFRLAHLQSILEGEKLFKYKYMSKKNFFFFNLEASWGFQTCSGITCLEQYLAPDSDSTLFNSLKVSDHFMEKNCMLWSFRVAKGMELCISWYCLISHMSYSRTALSYPIWYLILLIEPRFKYQYRNWNFEENRSCEYYCTFLLFFAPSCMYLFSLLTLV